MISDEYAAGFFDGEGTVYAATRNNKPSPTIMVCVTNTQPAPINALRARWGGSIFRHVSKNPRWQTKYQWALASRMAKPFLQAIRPHLLIKGEVVDAAIEFRTLMETPHRDRVDYDHLVFRKGRLWVSPTVKPEFREETMRLHRLIQQLNSVHAPNNGTRKYQPTANAA